MHLNVHNHVDWFGERNILPYLMHKLSVQATKRSKDDDKIKTAASLDLCVCAVCGKIPATEMLSRERSSLYRCLRYYQRYFSTTLMTKDRLYRETLCHKQRF